MKTLLRTIIICFCFLYTLEHSVKEIVLNPAQDFSTHGWERLNQNSEGHGLVISDTTKNNKLRGFDENRRDESARGRGRSSSGVNERNRRWIEYSNYVSQDIFEGDGYEVTRGVIHGTYLIQAGSGSILPALQHLHVEGVEHEEGNFTITQYENGMWEVQGTHTEMPQRVINIFDRTYATKCNSKLKDRPRSGEWLSYRIWRDEDGNWQATMVLKMKSRPGYPDEILEIKLVDASIGVGAGIVQH